MHLSPLRRLHVAPFDARYVDSTPAIAGRRAGEESARVELEIKQLPYFFVFVLVLNLGLFPHWLGV